MKTAWLKNLFKKKEPANTTYADVLSGYMPIFSQYNTDIYASDVVKQCLRCIVQEMVKIQPVHIRCQDNDPMPVTGEGSLQSVLNHPNNLMTLADFVEKTMWLLLLNYNAFIIPTFQEWKDTETGLIRKRYTGLYPIKPSQVDFIEDVAGELFIKFRFADNFETTLRYKDVIHIRYEYFLNEYMGGDEKGQPDHSEIKQTIQLNKDLLNGVAKSLKASYAVNGVVKYNTMMDKGKTAKALKELEGKLENNENGFLPLDLTGEFIPFEKKVALVDDRTLKFVDEKILRNWGVSLPILTGDYTKEQYEAFYQKTLEGFVIRFGQAFTKGLFTERQRAYGNKIEWYPEDLVFMTTEQKLNMVNMLSPTGALFENEKRRIFGMRPMPELVGKRYISLNWIDAMEASRYQTGKAEGEEGENSGAE